MAKIAVLASGSGSNFQVIAEKLAETNHTVECVICDRKQAFAFERAENLGIKSHYIKYPGRSREDAEKEIVEILNSYDVDLVVFAGFMRLITPYLVDSYKNRIVNIHPSLLPKYPGTHGIEDSFNSGDNELGITIHYVDYGMDTGPVITQKSFIRDGSETLDEIEEKIHQLEHETYPATVISLLDKIENNK